MNNGLLIYTPNPFNNIFNIGDYIQSLAAKQFFNEIDIYLNRENLNTYNGAKVKVIMNGWFMHNPNNWPPSNDIIPLFISFHLNKIAEKELLSEKSIEYFKQYQPIGCRDFNTLKLLKAKGIDAYFSGCLTLTLGNNYSNKGKGNIIYFTDVFCTFDKSISSIFASAKTIFFQPLTIYKILIKKEGVLSLRSILRTANFFNIYSQIFDKDILINAEYIKHEIYDNFNSEEAKFIYARELLQRYSEAKLIVTSRIHCALPSISMNTPVLYVQNLNDSEVSYCRLEGLIELFNIIKYKDGKLHYETSNNSKINVNSKITNKIINPNLILNLANKCKEFINI